MLYDDLEECDEECDLGGRREAQEGGDIRCVVSNV